MDEPNATGANTGLSDDAASGLAYLTFIPAIIFLVVAPYNTNPKVKFHAWQSIFLAIAWAVVMITIWIVSLILAFVPVVGWIISILLHFAALIGLVVLWLMTMIHAFQGKKFVIPVIGPLAAKQAGQ